MSAAAQPAVAHELTVQEELAALNGRELLAASKETTNVYNGIVLARACLIVQCRLRCHRPQDLLRHLNGGKARVYRWMRGTPISDSFFERAIRDLAFLLAEQA